MPYLVEGEFDVPVAAGAFAVVSSPETLGASAAVWAARDAYPSSRALRQASRWHGRRRDLLHLLKQNKIAPELVTSLFL